MGTPSPEYSLPTDCKVRMSDGLFIDFDELDVDEIISILRNGEEYVLCLLTKFADAAEKGYIYIHERRVSLSEECIIIDFQNKQIIDVGVTEFNPEEHVPENFTYIYIDIYELLWREVYKHLFYSER